MINDLKEFRSIDLLIDSEKNVVIFPRSKSKFPFVLPDGSVTESTYLVAYYPIELKYPYSTEQLAEKIKHGIEQWNRHECYNDIYIKGTFEEKYYNKKGFKNAVKGVMNISLGWDDYQGKYVSFLLPLKRGYAYMGLDRVKLPDDAGWTDFAEAVIRYINMDVTKLDSFKTYKSKLNL